MTTYLSRLVDRTLGRAAVVQPIIAPRFGRGPDLPAEGWAAEVADVPPAPGPAVAELGSESARTGLRSLPGEHRGPGAGGEGRALPEPFVTARPAAANSGTPGAASPSPASDPLPRLVRRDLPPARVVPTAAGTDAGAPPATSVSPDPGVPPVPARSREEGADRREPGRYAAPSARAVEEVPPALVPRRPEARPTDRLPPSVAVPLPPVEASSPRSAAARPTSTERAPLPAEARASAPAPSGQAPIIRVHVGRIDVRAVTAPAPAPAPAARGPRVTLSEYLEKQRRS